MKRIKPDKNCEEYKSAISVEKMRECDRYTIENFVSGRELMFRAAMGIYDSVQWKEKRVAVVCGSGNNGGDGYALAGILADHDIEVTLFRLGDKFSDDGRFYYNIAKIKEIPDVAFDEKADFSGYDIIVDCILGTGFHGAPEGIVRAAIEKINAAEAYVVCADINSGMNGDTGESVVAVKSDLTVSIGFYKTGLFENDAPKLIGELVNVDIGIVMIQ